MPTNGLSGRYRRFLAVTPGLYRFVLGAQGGARFWIDDRLAVDVWDEPGVSATVALPLGAARHDLLVEYRSPAKAGGVQLSWTRAGDLRTVYLPALPRN